MAKATPKPTAKPKVVVTKKATPAPVKKETRVSVGSGKNKAGTTATPGWQKGRGTI